MVPQRSGRRPQFTPFDRIIWLFLANVWDGWEKGPEIIYPDTVTGTSDYHNPAVDHLKLKTSEIHIRGSPSMRVFQTNLLGYSTALQLKGCCCLLPEPTGFPHLAAITIDHLPFPTS